MSEVGPSEVDDRPPSIQRLAATFSWIVFVLSALLLFVFAWPDIRDWIISFIDKVRPERIRDLTLFGYLASWIVAMFVDLRLQKYVYRDDPSQGAVARKGLGIAVSLFIPALFLIWSRNSETRTAIILNLFFVTNVFAWILAAKYALRVIVSSQEYYKDRDDAWLGLAQLRIVASYIAGPWHWLRFQVMLAIILMADVISFSSSAREGTSIFFHNAIPGVSADRISDLLPDIAIFFFVVVAETWSWVQRTRAVVKIAKLKRRAAFDQPRIAEYMNQFFDQQFKAVNYLLIAHAAAFVTTLTLLKDYLPFFKNADKAAEVALVNLQALRSLVILFAWGLVLAVLGYMMLSVARDSVMGAILLNAQRSAHEKSSFLAWGFCAGSALLLLVGILSVVSRLNGLGTISLGP